MVAGVSAAPEQEAVGLDTGEHGGMEAYALEASPAWTTTVGRP
ncbi:MAG: hypothetical protein ACE5MK_07210 [Acidobacteriota bacterium]